MIGTPSSFGVCGNPEAANILLAEVKEYVLGLGFIDTNSGYFQDEKRIRIVFKCSEPGTFEVIINFHPNEPAKKVKHFQNINGTFFAVSIDFMINQQNDDAYTEIKEAVAAARAALA